MTRRAIVFFGKPAGTGAEVAEGKLAAHIEANEALMVANQSLAAARDGSQATLEQARADLAEAEGHNRLGDDQIEKLEAALVVALREKREAEARVERLRGYAEDHEARVVANFELRCQRDERQRLINETIEFCKDNESSPARVVAQRMVTAVAAMASATASPSPLEQAASKFAALRTAWLDNSIGQAEWLELCEGFDWDLAPTPQPEGPASPVARKRHTVDCGGYDKDCECAPLRSQSTPTGETKPACSRNCEGGKSADPRDHAVNCPNSEPVATAAEGERPPTLMGNAPDWMRVGKPAKLKASGRLCLIENYDTLHEWVTFHGQRGVRWSWDEVEPPPVSPAASDAGGERALFSPGDRVRWRYSRDYEPTVTIIHCPAPPRTDADVRHDDGRKLIADTRDLALVASPPLPGELGQVEALQAMVQRAKENICEVIMRSPKDDPLWQAVRTSLRLLSEVAEELARKTGGGA